MVFGNVLRVIFVFGICVSAGQNSAGLVFSPSSAYPPITLYIEPAVNGENVIFIPLKTTNSPISQSAKDIAEAKGLSSNLPSVVRLTGRYKFDLPQKVNRAYILDGPKDVDVIQCSFYLADGRASELFGPGTTVLFDEKQAAGIQCTVYFVDDNFREIFRKFLKSEGS